MNKITKGQNSQIFCTNKLRTSLGCIAMIVFVFGFASQAETQTAKKIYFQMLSKSAALNFHSCELQNQITKATLLYFQKTTSGKKVTEVVNLNPPFWAQIEGDKEKWFVSPPFAINIKFSNPLDFDLQDTPLIYSRFSNQIKFSLLEENITAGKQCYTVQVELNEELVESLRQELKQRAQSLGLPGKDLDKLVKNELVRTRQYYIGKDDLLLYGNKYFDTSSHLITHVVRKNYSTNNIGSGDLFVVPAFAQKVVANSNKDFQKFMTAVTQNAATRAWNKLEADILSHRTNQTARQIGLAKEKKE